jgi:calcineurin-like phosphoesterase family protein
MPEVFAISDLHLGHNNVLNFTHDDKPLRDFANTDDMHECIIESWNSVVSPGDKVYVLGDVAMRKSALHLMNEMNGSKRLVLGNHDLYKSQVYLQYFKQLYGIRQINGLWLTHAPMELGAVEQERVGLNVHGHLHANRVAHPKYFNACVEAINYTPVSFDYLYAVADIARGED